MRRVPHEHISVLKAEIDELHNAKAVVPLTFPFPSPTILVKNQVQSMRLWSDDCKLNAVTKKDAHSHPRIKDIFDTLNCSKYFCTLDLAMEYHQAMVHLTAAKRPRSFDPSILSSKTSCLPDSQLKVRRLWDDNNRILGHILHYVPCILWWLNRPRSQLHRDAGSLRQNTWTARASKPNLKPSICAFEKSSLNFLSYVISNTKLRIDQKSFFVFKSRRVFTIKMKVPGGLYMRRNSESLYETLHTLLDL